MSFIDWSDCEGMLALLTEFISDAKQECRNDVERHRFLAVLLNQVRTWSDQAATISPNEAMHKLRAVSDSIDPEFKDDPVAIHVNDCIEAIDRL